MSRSKSLINNLLRHYASFVIIVLILMVSSTCDTVMVWPTISWKKSKNYVYVLRHYASFVIIVLILMVSSTCDTVMVWPKYHGKKVRIMNTFLQFHPNKSSVQMLKAHLLLTLNSYLFSRFCASYSR